MATSSTRAGWINAKNNTRSIIANVSTWIPQNGYIKTNSPSCMDKNRLIENSSHRTSITVSRFMSTVSPMDFVKHEITTNQVTIFSKTYCPHCKATKTLFANLNIPVQIHELDTMKDGPAIQAALLDLTGQRTVPNVFVKGKHIGGNDKTQEEYKNGNLLKMLE